MDNVARRLQVLFFTNTHTMLERCQPSPFHVPHSPPMSASFAALRPIEQLMFEAANELRNILELETWVNDPTAMRRLSLSEGSAKKRPIDRDPVPKSPPEKLDMFDNPREKSWRADVPPLSRTLPSVADLFPVRPPSTTLEFFPFAVPIGLTAQFSINHVPSILWGHIFSFLPITSIIQLGLVCKVWYSTIDNSFQLWKSILEDKTIRTENREKDWPAYTVNVHDPPRAHISNLQPVITKAQTGNLYVPSLPLNVNSLIAGSLKRNILSR